MQGCPLSPSLFSLYIDPLLRMLEHSIRGDPTASLHAFADDMAVHSTRLDTLQAAFGVMITKATPFGLVINVGKSEVHAWGDAPQATIFVRHQGRLYTLSTLARGGEPHTYYKYLGVYLFTNYSPQIMVAHYLAVVDSFFAALPDMLFSPKEATRLVNTQLVPKLAFRMTAHCLGHDHVIMIQNRVWTHYARTTQLPRHTPNKAHFASSQEGALGLFTSPLG